eukprot:scaffold2935_cov104-Isochrysis_galbana.AAC.4
MAAMAINDTVPEIFGSDAPTGSDGLFGYMLRQALVTIFYLTQDEFVLLLACALPFWYGVIAALQTVNGALQSRHARTCCRLHWSGTASRNLTSDGRSGVAQATCRLQPRLCATLSPTATRIASTLR